MKMPAEYVESLNLIAKLCPVRELHFMHKQEIQSRSQQPVENGK